MAVSKQKKIEIAEKIKGILKDAKSLVFVNFHGLGVSATTEMRRTLKNAGVSYYVAKKRLISRVLSDELGGSSPELPGEVALAWGDDLIAPAREIYGYQKKNPDNLKILGGIFDKRLMNESEMMEIAKIPTMPVLYGKFVNIINSPIQRFVIALSKVAEQKA